MPKGYERKNKASDYNPSDEHKAMIAMVRDDYSLGERIMQKPYVEFNHRSVVEETNMNQKMFNTYIAPKSTDPDESWRAQTVRPIVRNKLISLAAHVTANVIYPAFFAQNRQDEEDRGAAEVMRLLSQWIIDNSNYELEFVNGVLQGLTDPAMIMQAEYLEVMRKVREKGKVTKKILDETLSGFLYNTVRVRDLLISNIYEPNIQKQRFLIYRRFIDYAEAELLYGEDKSFQYVSPGIKFLYSDETDMFYSVQDNDTQENMVEVVTYYNRFEDLEVTMINGILIGDCYQPMRRRDKLYPFAKTGYEPLNNGKFFYYKSAANKLGPDEKLVNTTYNMVMDGTVLQLMPPMALYGGEEIGASVMRPGVITGFDNPDTKLESIAPRMDLRAGLMATEMIERSITESSQENLRSGVASPKEMTAFEVQRIEQNAKVALGLFDKQIRFLVKDLGLLMVGDVKQYLTIPDITKLQSEGQRLSYGKYFVNEVESNSRSEVRFSDQDLGADEVLESEVENREFEIYEEEEKTGKKIYMANPVVFRDFKFKVAIAPDVLRPKNEAFERALNLEAYDRAIQNTNLDQAEVTKEFLLEPIRPGESQRFMAKQQAQPQEQMQQKGVNQNMTGQITKSNSLTGTLSQ